MKKRRQIDVIYVAASARDARFARICVASIRYFYPEVPIKMLAGDTLDRKLVFELQRYWNVQVVDLPNGVYGWGMIKLEALFGPAGCTFMVCDSDTVFTGPVLDLWTTSDAPFIVDNEKIPEDQLKRLYFDWDEMAAIDSHVVSRPQCFNSGQWFGTAGLIHREDFATLIEWTLPRRLLYQNAFMGGDQGVLNYVILKKEKYEGLRIDRRPIMRWPGYANGLDELNVANISAKTAPPRVVHWAGVKSIFLSRMAGAEILKFYENDYYKRIPFGRTRRMLAFARHVWLNFSYHASVPFRLRWRKMFARVPKYAPVFVTDTIRQ